jgi:hypothetical protein
MRLYGVFIAICATACPTKNTTIRSQQVPPKTTRLVSPAGKAGSGAIPSVRAVLVVTDIAYLLDQGWALLSVRKWHSRMTKDGFPEG